MKHTPLYVLCASAICAALLTASVASAVDYNYTYYFKRPIKVRKVNPRTAQNLRPYLYAQLSGTDFNQKVLLAETDAWNAYNNAKKNFEALFAPLNNTGQEYKDTMDKVFRPNAMDYLTAVLQK